MRLANESSIEQKLEEQLADYPLVLSIPQLTKITGMSRQLLTRDAEAGNLPFVKCGKRWYMAKAALIEYLVKGSAYGE